MEENPSGAKDTATFILFGEEGSLYTSLNWGESDLLTLAKTYSRLVAEDAWFAKGDGKYCIEMNSDEGILSGELPKIEGAMLCKMETIKIAEIGTVIDAMEIASLPGSVYLRGMELLAKFGCVSSILDFMQSGHFPEGLQEQAEAMAQDAMDICAKRGWVNSLANLILNANGESRYNDICNEVSPFLIIAMQKCAIDEGGRHILEDIERTVLPEGIKTEARRLLNGNTGSETNFDSRKTDSSVRIVPIIAAAVPLNGTAKQGELAPLPKTPSAAAQKETRADIILPGRTIEVRIPDKFLPDDRKPFPKKRGASSDCNVPKQPFAQAPAKSPINPEPPKRTELLIRAAPKG